MSARVGPLLAGVLVSGLGLFFLLGALAVGGEAGHAGVGPRAFPVLVGAGLVALGIAFLIAQRRGTELPDAAAPARRGVLPWILGGLVGGILAVEPLGFPLAAAWLFVMGARGFGSRRWIPNAALGLALGLVVYAVFARALGVSLPGGPVDVLWTRR
jgi:putative tricarboxylic transport membrane protein